MISFSEHLLMDGFGYSYGIAAGDLTGNGHLDVTAADADGRALFWFESDGKGGFTRHHIQRDHPKERLERHALGDVNGNGRLDVVIVENLTGDLYWFENNGKPADGELWRLHTITEQGLPFAYDVAVADFDADGDLDVAASSWMANAVAWFENTGAPGEGPWVKHMIDPDLPGAYDSHRGLRQGRSP